MFPSVSEAPMPGGALLKQFADRGEYTDCFVADVDAVVSFAAFVEAFYTTTVFRLERFILKWLVSRPSTDDQAGKIARGEIDSFAAWSMHERSENQLLMMDLRGQTCSWFMVVPIESGSRLYFGTAVMRRKETPAGRGLTWVYRSLMGFHRFYSRVLLQAAHSKIAATA